MSISPSAIRLMRWQSRHRILTDSVLSLLVLGLDVLLSLAPLLISGELPSFESWLPATIAATVCPFTRKGSSKKLSSPLPSCGSAFISAGEMRLPHSGSSRADKAAWAAWFSGSL